MYCTSKYDDSNSLILEEGGQPFSNFSARLFIANLSGDARMLGYRHEL
jgi:hypothetical protein